MISFIVPSHSDSNEIVNQIELEEIEANNAVPEHTDHVDYVVEDGNDQDHALEQERAEPDAMVAMDVDETDNGDNATIVPAHNDENANSAMAAVQDDFGMHVETDLEHVSGGGWDDEEEGIQQQEFNGK